MEDGKRCCRREPLSFHNNDILPSKYIEEDVVCCGAFDSKAPDEARQEGEGHEPYIQT
jgi:hypothetical protein